MRSQYFNQINNKDDQLKDEDIFSNQIIECDKKLTEGKAKDSNNKITLGHQNKCAEQNKNKRLEKKNF